MDEQDAKPAAGPATAMHRLPRLFVSAGLGAEGRVALSAGQAHQLANVLRHAVGDRVVLFNGRDGEWLGRLSGLTRKAAEVALEHLLRPQPTEAGIRLCFAPLKQGRIDWLVEKATELGAARLTPVLTRRTQIPKVNRERLCAIAIEAAEQCERLSIPAIDEPMTLDKLLAGWPADMPLMACLERRDAPLLGRVAPPPPFGILIGPEGGFAPEEVAVLAGRGIVKPVSLGPRILRAETAAIAALALCLMAG